MRCREIMHFAVLFTTFLLLPSANSHAQFTHVFTETARNTDYGSANGLAVGPDGTVFTAQGHGGLHAYVHEGTSLVHTASVYSGGFARAVAVGPDGAVFLANSEDGLQAYSYDGGHFINTAHALTDSGDAHDVAVGPDGTVFLANFEDGLRAFSYNGAAFVNAAHVNTEGNAAAVAVNSND